ncbi:helix-turn-helix transcriptional regulator [Pontibacter sp. Tf4]|uniref:helix-turn-helix domain-containing protein n=1 Tax=Pontibacter sp. Tf4 TaxID=2761620 RepID=UPI001624942B|nr:AraC family transcriptional regulator [Pontibacter sp. Tf4]MBB6610543.1 helix-turn-helix transcriptional regulator [Pontibacter sp. Tf4]
MDKKDCEQVQELHIKNMVCPRCIKVVQDELVRIGVKVIEVELGCAIVCVPDVETFKSITAALEAFGFELLQDKRATLVEQIKLLILDLIHQNKLPQLQTTISTYLADELHKDYGTLSTTFKELEELPLSRYVILQKIERAKELLEYKEQNVSEVASLLGYKSIQHFSAQFKEVTGYTPLQYRNQEIHLRVPLTDVIELGA